MGTLAQARGQKNNDSKTYLVGDSQAADMLNAISQIETAPSLNFPPRVHHVQYSCGAVVVPTKNLDKFYNDENILFIKTKSNREQCEKQRNTAFSPNALKGSNLIIISPYWSKYLTKYLPDTIAHIQKETKATIVIVGQKHMLASSTGIYQKHKSFAGIEEAAAGFIDPETIAINKEIEIIANQKGVLFFNSLSALCPTAQSCQVVGSRGGPITYDTHHLTPEGAELMGRHFASWLAGLNHRSTATSLMEQ
ncbi:hypothetical protein LRS11_07310 [Pseudomonas sp. J452]|uniref:SGNH hydrolase domain-containing protein n=1 Tax=Pseudomonas sp. J452 TaxID=2898441 RepID=UPI0021AE0A51|nr:SGNH hydrolase domain-containing protein [Pseudomonas sp. J452]UUY09836.1 hypothetical protein LRS11_07310 [Pseudomonas sp. J452]